MPRNVRPSWCDLKVDNRGNNPQIVKATGPQSRTGSLSAAFKARHMGSVVDVLTVDAIASADGKLVRYTARNGHGQIVWSEEFTQ